MNPADLAKYEKLARESGYTESELNLARQKYGNQNQSKESKLLDIKKIDDDYLSDSLTDNDSLSSIDKNQPDDINTDTVEGLPYFGYEIFRKIPDAFKPNAVGPVDPGYLVGPGDKLRLSVWGQAEFQYELIVSKEGKIFIPVIGQVYVTGVPFETLQEKIKSLLSRNYSGLSASPQHTFMDLTVAKMRPVRIFIMGEVKQPGGYTVSSYATTFNALYSIGGPLARGSLRNIKIIRNGREIAIVDLYDYLLGGKCTTDVRLQNNDVVFIPPRSKTVAITGSVFRPAYYELTEKDNLNSLLAYCGGISSLTNLDRAYLHRVLPFDMRDGALSLTRITDVNLKEYLLEKKDFVLYDNDSIALTPLYADMKNQVTLSGAVMYPGVYQSDTITLADLIFKYGKLIDDKSYTVRADLFRLNEDFITKKVFPIDLKRLQNESSYNRKMLPGDSVLVYNNTVEKPNDLFISVEGEVNKPGNYTMSTNMTVADAVILAGGFGRKAYRKYVDVYRRNVTSVDSLCNIYKISLPDSFSYLDENVRSFNLEDRDRIVVRVNPDYNEISMVKITGQVKYQGNFALISRRENINGIIDRAGGLMPDAYLGGAKVFREKNRLILDLDKAYNGKDERENILVKNGDSIYIPKRPNTVSVSGNVNNPGLFSFVENSSLINYISKAGGIQDSTELFLLTSPNGATKKLKNFVKGPKILDGSSIVVTKKKAVDQSNKKQGPTVAEVIRDTLAIITSAVTIIALAVQLK
jgi:protein involved in polysaccharide export with SLBB domain